MQIQVNTDHNIHGHETLIGEVTTLLTDALQRFAGHITRLEVHLSDENGPKGGADDIRCMLEARLEGRKPIAVTHYSSVLMTAVHGAIDHLIRVIETTEAKVEAKAEHPDVSGKI